MTSASSLRRVAVLMGGISPEHPVSLASGCGVLAHADPARYTAFPVLIARDNTWIWPRDPADFAAGMTVEQAQALLASPPSNWASARFAPDMALPPADIFFLALHGAGGEDGTLQAVLEARGVPFTGSGSAASALSMDKIASKERYRERGVPTAPWLVLPPAEYADVAHAADAVERVVGLPAVVKDPVGGSSIGVAVVKTRAELEKAVREIGATASRLLIEAFVTGREATCGVLEGSPKPLPPTEIRPKKDGFFSFEEKYRKDGAEEITPAEFPPVINAEMQRLAALAHAALGLSVYSRTDFIWNPADDSLCALETNNLPGLTPKSIIPQQAAAIGVSYRELVTEVIERSLR